MDYTTCYCRSSQCPLYGQVAPRARLKMHDWRRQVPRFRCERCVDVVSATTGTAGDTHRPAYLPERSDGASGRVADAGDRTPGEGSPGYG